VLKHTIRKISGLCVALLLIAGVIYLHYSPSVLLKYQDPSAVDPSDCLWVLFNPFRDRQPELSADAFLKQLKKEKFDEAFARFPEHTKASFCSKEREFKLINWTLVDRKDEGVKTVLHFEVYRSDQGPNAWGNVWVTVEKQDVWRVTSFESWY